MSWTVRQLNELQRAFVALHADDRVMSVRIVGGPAAPTVLVTLPPDVERASVELPESFEGLPVRVESGQPMVLAYA
jgi:hypothetical protein